METRLLFLQALSPLHAGTGQGVGVIDLPIAREKSTGIPYLPGSSVKGVLRDACPDANRNKVFGPDKNNGEDHASSVHFSDQRLLLLPIRSLAGTFAWVTSPYVLRRFKREVLDIGMNGLPEDIPTIPNTETCHVAKGSQLIVESMSKVCLEDLDLAYETKATEWAAWLAPCIFDDAEWQDILKDRLCIVHDDVLTFLLTTATEITARIKLKEETKTVAQGQLWYEEALPTETILSGLVLSNPTKQSGINDETVFKTIGNLTAKSKQFGGKATVGRGMCRMQLVKGGA